MSAIGFRLLELRRRIRQAFTIPDHVDVAEESDQRLRVGRVPFIQEQNAHDARRLSRFTEVVSMLLNSLIDDDTLVPSTDDGEGLVRYKLDVLQALLAQVTSAGAFGSMEPGRVPTLLTPEDLVRLITRADGVGSGVDADVIRGAPFFDMVEETAKTTDGSATTIGTLPITANRTYKIESHVVARRTGGSAGTADDGAVYKLEVAATTKAGVVTLGASTVTVYYEDQAAWDVVFLVSGSNVLIRGTGAANNNVDWKHITYLEWVE